jgi:hypothetical protein
MVREKKKKKRKRKHTLLQQHNPRKPVVQIPKVHARYSALVVQLPVHIKRLVRAHLHLPYPLPRHGALARTFIPAGAHAAETAFIERRVELVGPRRAVAIAVAVVVAYEVVAAGLLAATDFEGLVDGREEVLG